MDSLKNIYVDIVAILKFAFEIKERLEALEKQCGYEKDKIVFHHPVLDRCYKGTGLRHNEFTGEGDDG